MATRRVLVLPSGADPALSPDDDILDILFSFMLNAAICKQEIKTGRERFDTMTEDVLKGVRMTFDAKAAQINTPEEWFQVRAEGRQAFMAGATVPAETKADERLKLAVALTKTYFESASTTLDTDQKWDETLLEGTKIMDAVLGRLDGSGSE